MREKIALFICLAALPSQATITLNTYFGTLRDASGVSVQDGTLWALVADTNNDDTFAGFGINDSFINAPSPETHFTQGQSFTIGDLINGDTIFAMGATQSGGLVMGTEVLTLGQNGVAAGRDFVLYWFPGAVYTGGASESIDSQVGGVNRATDDGPLLKMIFPVDGVNDFFGAADSSAGGTTNSTYFQAVQLVPEPSTFLLGGLASLWLMSRRRRNS